MHTLVYLYIYDNVATTGQNGFITSNTHLLYKQKANEFRLGIIGNRFIRWHTHVCLTHVTSALIPLKRFKSMKWRGVCMFFTIWVILFKQILNHRNYSTVESQKKHEIKISNDYHNVKFWYNLLCKIYALNRNCFHKICNSKFVARVFKQIIKLFTRALGLGYFLFIELY